MDGLDLAREKQIKKQSNTLPQAAGFTRIQVEKQTNRQRKIQERERDRGIVRDRQR